MKNLARLLCLLAAGVAFAQRAPTPYMVVRDADAPVAGSTFCTTARDRWIRTHPGGRVFYCSTITGKWEIAETPAAVTLSSDAFNVDNTSPWPTLFVLTSQSGSADTLTTISGGFTGQVIAIAPASGHTITVTDASSGSGAIDVYGSKTKSCVLDDPDEVIEIVRRSSGVWAAIGGACGASSWNGPPPVCAVLESLVAGDDNYAFFMANEAVTITAVGCNCRGTCSTLATFTLEDRGGNAMTITDTNPTCATTGAATFKAVSGAHASLTAGEMVAFDVTNTPTTGDTYAICVTYTVDTP